MDVTDEAKKIRAFLRANPDKAAQIVRAQMEEGIVRAILTAALGDAAEKIPTDLGLAIMGFGHGITRIRTAASSDG